MIDQNTYDFTPEGINKMMIGASRMDDKIGVLGKSLPNINIESLLEKEIGGLIDYKLWRETINIQISFNNKIAPGWREEENKDKYDFWMAILDEVVEVLGSRHWKWWKNSEQLGVIDWDNITVELVDLFHFILSVAIQHGNTDLFFTTLISQESCKQHDSSTDLKRDDFIETVWDKMLLSTQMKTLPMLIVTWAELWYQAGGDATSLFKEYRIKAALNLIRQEFGYGAKNSYIKNWPSPTDKNKIVEDNVVAWEITQDIPMDENTLETITKELRKYYLSNVAL